MPLAFELAAIERRIAALDPAPRATPADAARFADLIATPAIATSGAASPAAAAVPTAEIARLIDAAAARYGVDPALVRAVVRQESGFDPAARSNVGARGLMQLMPDTAAALGVSDPDDAAQNVDGGTRYLRSLLDRFGGDVRRAVAAYNAGPGAVDRYDGVPPYAETMNYVAAVLDGYATARTGRA